MDNWEDWEDEEVQISGEEENAFEDEDKELKERLQREEALEKKLAKVKLEKKEKKKEEVEEEEVVSLTEQRRRDKIRKEEADFQTTKEMFANTEGFDSEGVTSFDQFRVYAKLLAEKIVPLKTQFNYKEFIIELNQLLVQDLRPEDIKEIVKNLNIIINEKIRDSKPKKKTSSKKKSLKMAAGDELEANVYSDDDDYDFM